VDSVHEFDEDMCVKEQETSRPVSSRRAGGNMINGSRLYLKSNGHMVPVEQRHILYAQPEANTFGFGVFSAPEFTVIEQLATDQTTKYVQEQCRVMENELRMTERNYLTERYLPDKIISIRKGS